MIYAQLVFLVVFGAFANRHRGGWIGTGHTQLARLDFSLATALMLYLGSLNMLAALIALPVAFLTFIGCLAGQGEDQADDTVLKVLGLAGSAACNMLGVVFAGWWLVLQPHSLHVMWEQLTWHPVFLALPIAMIGKPLAYFIGRYLPGNLIPYILGQGFARGQTEWGEVLFGMIEGFTVWFVTIGYKLL